MTLVSLMAPHMVAEVTAVLHRPISGDEVAAFRSRVVWFPGEETVTVSDDLCTVVVRAPGQQDMWRHRVAEVLRIQGIGATTTGRMALA